MLSLMHALRRGSSRRAVIIAALTAGSLLSACGGGGKKKTDGAGGGAPAFDACVETAKPIAAAQLAAGSVVDGAQLYDRWVGVLGVTAPTTEQPLWATRVNATLTKTADETWRCKNCHGWDYAGKDGAYGPSSSNYTGFPGILSAKTLYATQPEKVFCSIKVGTLLNGSKHEFGSKFGDDAHAWNLTKFILDPTGVIDTSQYIAANKGIFNAVISDGSTAYTTGRCGSCHGDTGDTYADDGAGLGFLAVDNPWEVMHKVRFGDPDVVDGFTMAAYQTEFNATRGLSISQIASMIAWAQAAPPAGLTGGTGTIPPAGSPGTGGGGGGVIPTASGKYLGGLIYDNPITTLNKTTYTSGNPFMDLLKANPAANADVGTWRCKNCHGWDYKGVEGVNAGGLPTTRANTNLYLSKDKPKAFLRDKIKFGFTQTTATGSALFHAFGIDPNSVAKAGYSNGPAVATGTAVTGPGLSDVEIDAVVDFITQGLIDSNVYILAGGSANGGNPDLGAAHFKETTVTKSGACNTCHGDDGAKIDFDSDPTLTEYVGTIADDNPWEFLHKARWGQPASEMQGMVEASAADDAALAEKVLHLLRFAQDRLTP